nr:T9SS type A sorting domain-containing protein [Candidatus Cloacimonadota bacterium]
GVEAVYDEGTSARVSCPFDYNGTGNNGQLIAKDELSGNYPNPFNPTTTISFFTTESTENTEISVYNLKGQKVKQLLNAQLAAGRHSVVWNGTDDNGKAVSSGIYFYKMKSGKYLETKKMILMK